ncbi:MAG TPA: serine dehydratase [Clostridiales bacterium]|mgnify:CR=1 FL=1|nr:serine dehydratase [Clostridiales bacterium]
MLSLKKLFKTGRGPSSSHTMGPEKAAKIFSARYKEADEFTVTLYGSLASTGKGHSTDRVLESTLAPKKCKIFFDEVSPCSVHPNTIDFAAFKNGKKLGEARVYSVGGGDIRFDGEKEKEEADVYALSTFSSIADYCRQNCIRIPDYVEKIEGKQIFDYLMKVWQTMRNSVEEGLNASGVLPGILKTERKAKKLFSQKLDGESAQTRENRLVCSYAFAVSEQNAAGGIIVTAPTCGSCGVVPSVLLYEQQTKGFTDEQIVRALATAGVIGNIIKTNASISGAECGCQAEIGSACSMAAAALAELRALSLEEIDCAAEIAMEHHLGLTCDPIAGLVQIPCIERNAVAAMRAINAVSLADFLSDSRKISFDLIVETMYNTGKDLLSGYKETSSSGLAKYYPFSISETKS